jgi:hypothetical protein
MLPLDLGERCPTLISSLSIAKAAVRNGAMETAMAREEQYAGILARG